MPLHVGRTLWHLLERVEKFRENLCLVFVKMEV
jgi:hypothetical protein